MIQCGHSLLACWIFGLRVTILELKYARVYVLCELAPGTGPSDVPLPAGWVVNQCTKTGRTYYSVRRIIELSEQCQHALAGCVINRNMQIILSAIQGQNSGRLQWKPPTEPDVPGARPASGGVPRTVVHQDAEARPIAERQKEMENRVSLGPRCCRRRTMQ